MGILNYAPALINALMGGSQANAAPAPQSTPATSPPTQVVPTDDYTTVVRPDVVARKGAAWVGDKKTTKQMVIDDYNFNKNSTAKPASTDSSTDSSADVGLPEENHSFEASPETTTATHPWFQNGSPFSFVGGGINKLTSAVGGDRKIVTSLDANGKPLGTDTNGKPMTLPSYDDNGNQKTLAATEDPNSLLGILKGGIPAIIGNMAPVNMASKLLGLGSTAQNDRPSGSNGDLFKGSNQTIDPQVKADIQQKYDQMTSDAQMAATSPIDYLINKAAASKNAYDTAIAGMNTNFHSQQQIGAGSEGSTAELLTQSKARNAAISSLNNLEKALQGGHGSITAAEISTALNNLSKIPGVGQLHADMQEALTADKMQDWLSGPNAINNWKAVKGFIHGAISQARTQSEGEQRVKDTIPGITDEQIGHFDPTWNIKNDKGVVTHGMPNFDAIDKEIELGSVGNAFNQGGKDIVKTQAQLEAENRAYRLGGDLTAVKDGVLSIWDYMTQNNIPLTPAEAKAKKSEESAPPAKKHADGNSEFKGPDADAKYQRAKASGKPGAQSWIKQYEAANGK